MRCTILGTDLVPNHCRVGGQRFLFIDFPSAWCEVDDSDVAFIVGCTRVEQRPLARAQAVSRLIPNGPQRAVLHKLLDAPSA